VNKKLGEPFQKILPFISFFIPGYNCSKTSVGAADTINAGAIKVIQFGFGNCDINSRTFFRDFRNLLSPDYHLYRLLKDGIYPVANYSVYGEIFATINYYAELK
jgi:hypothetical protein